MTGGTCASVAARTPRAMAARAEAALRVADYAELRLDFLRPADVPAALELARRRMRRCVCTIRPRAEGGAFSGTERERRRLLLEAAGRRPMLLDVEHSALSRDPGLARRAGAAGCRVMASWHDLSGTPAPGALLRRMEAMRASSDTLKIVTTARRPGDAAAVLSLYGAAGPGTRLVAFAMGEAGRASRVLCLHLGSPLAYVSWGRAVAPGQLSPAAMARALGRRPRRRA